MLALHLRAELQSPIRDLRCPALAGPLWQSLRRRLPEVHAAAILPRRLDVIVPACDPLLARRALSQACGEMQRLAALPSGVWAPPRLPEAIGHVDALRARVIALAVLECRAQLAADPLEPIWSTFRDVMGATAETWVDPRRLAGALRVGIDRLRPFILSEVARVPGLEPTASMAPRAAAPSLRPSHNLEDLALAAATTWRRGPGAVSRCGPARALFVALARHAGWRDLEALAERARVHPARMPALVAKVEGRALAAGARCLGDPRLLLRVRAGQGPREPLTAGDEGGVRPLLGA